MRARRDIYLDILHRGLLSARSAGYAGDAAQAATEADHLHNLPELLLHLGDEWRHAFYREGMRPSYLGESKPEYAQRFAPLWEELEAANRAAGSGTLRSRPVRPALPGQRCLAGACASPCEGVSCPFGQECRAGRCVPPPETRRSAKAISSARMTRGSRGTGSAGSAAPADHARPVSAARPTVAASPTTATT